MRWGVLLASAVVIVGGADQASARSAESDAAIGAYNQCAQAVAVRLEVGGDAPDDVALGAAYVCLPEEAKAMNALLAEGDKNIELRGSALFFARGAAVSARACRKGGVCLMSQAPLPARLQPKR
jgi:hypothetical protein